METMKNNLEYFCDQFDYPKDCKEVMVETFDIISKNEYGVKLFSNLLVDYSKDYQDFNFKSVLVKLGDLSKEIKLNEYTVSLVFLALLTKQLKIFYEENNIPNHVFHETLLDLKYKTLECKSYYGVWGIFVANWYEGFFKLKLFALGRLQFEVVAFNNEYSKEDLIVSKNDKVINVHIPSSGKSLTKEACMESFDLAKVFFEKELKTEKTIFMCDSWLLFPKQREFLSPHSGIIMFMDFFDIFISRDEEFFYDAFRIYGRDFDLNDKELPLKTSLQKAYYNWIKAGNSIGIGIGVFSC